MPRQPADTPRPEAGADTEQGRQGAAPDGHRAPSGGTRTRAGSDYGDYVPDRGRPKRNEDRDADTPAMEDCSTADGNVDRLGEGPAGPLHPRATPETPARPPRDETREQRHETAEETRENKGSDTSHVHSSTTSRRV